jgi:hypothetical protein
MVEAIPLRGCVIHYFFFGDYFYKKNNEKNLKISKNNP